MAHPFIFSSDITCEALILNYYQVNSFWDLNLFSNIGKCFFFLFQITYLFYGMSNIFLYLLNFFKKFYKNNLIFFIWSCYLISGQLIKSATQLPHLVSVWSKFNNLIFFLVNQKQNCPQSFLKFDSSLRSSFLFKQSQIEIKYFPWL